MSERKTVESKQKTEDDTESSIPVTLTDGPIGIVFDSEFVIKQVEKDSPFYNKCKVGDKIGQVNDAKVENESGFQEALQKFGPTITITLVRGLKSSEVKIPPAREKNLARQDGFLYHVTQIDYIKGCKFGLGIKHFHNKVLVTRVDAGSLSAKSLMVADRIVDVNGSPVTDKEVARTLLLKALQKDRKVSLLIERPFSKEAKDKVAFALNQSEMQAPSVAMASDIQAIIAKQKAKMKEASKEPKKGLLRKDKAAPQGKVQVRPENPNVVIIASDNEGKQLKPVKP
ncbi:unnamed protein product [Bursaphelenchus xylophilus]|uniref:(pine wood nematode) hypothetical protein n=1 Tax=Bursaphelenchus xylophilus TaxID=6326 RepID=A0A1I7RS16_BURXY|nr:unnamed protein product [Bursaphelenchus xylophilus]CAG9123323.1 unnamed protein product [Bursaphelenchus xylophilus]